MNGMTTVHTTNELIDFMINGHFSSPASSENSFGEATIRSTQHAYPPYIEIIEQPSSKALRFRYECEGRPGDVQGVNSAPENRTYPKIRIVNYRGPALIAVSCVTKDEPYRAHPHKLVCKDSTHSQNGTYTVEINNEDMTHTFQNLGVQRVKKENIIESLQIREKCRVDPFRQGFIHKFTFHQIDMNAFRLCFQAFLPSPGTRKFNVVVPPVVSEPIYDRNVTKGLTEDPSPENAGDEATVMSTHQRATPYIEIIEQPSSEALRFRYECEGRPSGVHGVHSTPENRTYPKIRIVNYRGPALIVVSCVTKDEPYRAHPYKLVCRGSHYPKKGVYAIEMNNENMAHTLQNLGIQCVKKKDIIQSLTIREECRVDPFRQGFSHKLSPRQIDLKAIRLCFQAFLPRPGTRNFNVVVPPVVSEPIYDRTRSDRRG